MSLLIEHWLIIVAVQCWKQIVIGQPSRKNASFTDKENGAITLILMILSQTTP